MNPRNQLEDWLTELPPLDGGDEDPESTDEHAEDIVLDDHDDSSLDDSAAEDLDVEEEMDVADDGASSGDDENWEADIGEPELDLADDEASGADGDGPSTPDSDVDIDDDPPISDDDAGEEGTTDSIEHSLDEDLPLLDSDDEGDFEDVLMLEVGLAAASQESFPWAQPPWEARAGSATSVSLPTSEDDSIALMSIAPSANVLAAATRDGAVIVVAGRSPVADVSAADASSTTVCTDQLRAALADGTPAFVAVSSKHPTIWIAGRAGQLAKSSDFGKGWNRCAGLGRPILALGSREDGSISALARRGDVLEILTSADGTRWFAQRISLEVPPASPQPHASAWICHRGQAVAIGHAAGVWISRDGKHFAKVVGSAASTAGTFAGPAADASLVFACASAQNDETTHLVRVSADGTPEIVAAVRPTDASDEADPAKVLALAWDETQATVRVACATQVSAWGPAAKDLT